MNVILNNLLIVFVVFFFFFLMWIMIDISFRDKFKSWHILLLTCFSTVIMCFLFYNSNKTKMQNAKIFLSKAHNKNITLKCFNQVNVYNKCYEYIPDIDKYSISGYDFNFLKVVSNGEFYEDIYENIIGDNIYCKALSEKISNSNVTIKSLLKQIAVEQNQVRCNLERNQITKILNESN